MISVPPLLRISGILQGTSIVGVEFFRGMPIIVMEFFRVLVKLMWNSSGYNEVDVEFFRAMLSLPIIVMEFFRDKGFEILQAEGKVL